MITLSHFEHNLQLSLQAAQKPDISTFLLLSRKELVELYWKTSDVLWIAQAFCQGWSVPNQGLVRYLTFCALLNYYFLCLCNYLNWFLSASWKMGTFTKIPQCHWWHNQHNNTIDFHLIYHPQMFVRLFVDENLDRHVPISKQPKEKIQVSSHP